MSNFGFNSGPGGAAAMPPLQTPRRAAPHLGDRVADHMTREMILAREEETVGSLLERLRVATGLRERIVYFYVVDQRGALVGVIPTRRLLMSSPDRRLGEILIRGVVRLRPETTIEQAIEEFLRHRFLAFPVTDADDRLVGVIDASAFTSELSEIAGRRSFEDIFQLIGVHLEARPTNPLSSYRQRFPWLTANILGGLACALIAGAYEQLLETAVVLALFIPIVLALAESVSVQSVTITIQRLHDNRPGILGLLRSIGRELLVAILLGATCGLIVGSIAYLWKGEPLVASAIGLAIMFSMITACLLGVAFPTLMKMLHLDPKVAAGPMVLATADIATMILYFSLAMHLLVH